MLAIFPGDFRSVPRLTACKEGCHSVSCWSGEFLEDAWFFLFVCLPKDSPIDLQCRYVTTCLANGFAIYGRASIISSLGGAMGKFSMHTLGTCIISILETYLKYVCLLYILCWWYTSICMGDFYFMICHYV